MVSAARFGGIWLHFKNEICIPTVYSTLGRGGAVVVSFSGLLLSVKTADSADRYYLTIFPLDISRKTVYDVP